MKNFFIKIIAISLSVFIAVFSAGCSDKNAEGVETSSISSEPASSEQASSVPSEEPESSASKEPESSEVVSSEETDDNVEPKYIRGKLPLITPDGDDLAYHPSVVRFDKEWNGYKYWMAFTPYPNSDATKENPVINVSNDMKSWEIPSGLTNPIDKPDPSDKKHYFSDVNLIYNSAEARLELFWRYVCDDPGVPGNITIFKSVSYDGVHWTEREKFLYLDNRNKHDWMSPAIILENGIYRMWYVDVDYKVYYAEITDGVLGEATCLDIAYDQPMNSWHLDVLYNKEKNLYEMVLCSFKPNNSRRTMSLYYSCSSDNSNWSKAVRILRPSADVNGWDSQGLYKASLLYNDGCYYMFYSAHGPERVNLGVGLMYGSDIYNLKSYI